MFLEVVSVGVKVVTSVLGLGLVTLETGLEVVDLGLAALEVGLEVVDLGLGIWVVMGLGFATLGLEFVGLVLTGFTTLELSAVEELGLVFSVIGLEVRALARDVWFVDLFTAAVVVVVGVIVSVDIFTVVGFFS